MDLQGNGAVALAAAAVSLGLLGGTLLQHVVRGRGPGQLLLRLLVTTLSCSLVVLGIAVELNRENGWYASFADLAGGRSAARGDGAGTSVTVATPLARQQHATGHQQAPLPPLPLPGSRVQKYRLTGPSGITNPVVVLLPRGYDDPANAGRRYPVVLLGHGVPGVVSQWLGPMDIRRHADPLVAAGRLADAIYVMPALEASEDTDTECVTSAGHADDRMEQWLSQDVPNFVTSHFRVQDSPAAWATMGFSAGGWCAAMLTMLHPDRFGSAIVLGGYFQPWWPGVAPWPATSPQARRLDLVHLAATRPPAVDLWVQSSLQDPESGPSTRRFVAAATARAHSPLQLAVVMDPTGGHRSSIWNGHVDEALLWLAHARPAFA